MSLFEFLPMVNRPTRYLGDEPGSIRKDPAQVDLSLALAFPDVYEVGMSHLGSAILYHVINSLEWAAAERVYAPWPDLEEHLRRSADPLRSLENQRPLHDFDIVGFSLQYELSYSNLLNMLDLGGIPRRRENRDESMPLVIVGGPCAFNPEPLADFFDCAVIGDAEEALVELCQAVREGKRSGMKRSTLLDRLAEIEGIYVPSHFQPAYREDGVLADVRPLRAQRPKVRRRFLADLDAAPFPDHPIIPFMQTVHNRVAMEVARGCTRGCRFCQAGYLYRPVRERSPERIAELIENSLRHSGFDEISLLSLSTGDYSCITPLLTGLMNRYADTRTAVSLPSLRVGTLSRELMEQIKRVRKTGFTLAPEAGTERLRKIINKDIRTEDLLAATQQAYALGWRLVKLYFMIGLPGETETDLDAIVGLAAEVKRTGKGSPGGNDVNVSVSTFVPKPHTPFQWEAQIGPAETEHRQNHLRGALAKRKLRFKWHDAQLSFLEGVFARGDRRLGAVLERAVDLGCRFDGWREHFRFDLWTQAFADSGLDPAWYLRARDVAEVLPWDHLDCGVNKEYFFREKQRALQNQPTPDCRNGTCTGCGVCDFQSLKTRLVTVGDFGLGMPAGASDQPPETRRKIRLRLRKTGRVRFISHLEFMTMLHRAVRRAEIPVRFSAGFHPSPKISFGDALPTGVESDAEIIDIELIQPWPAQKLAAALEKQLPEGLHILESSEVDWQTSSPSVSIKKSVFRIDLPVEVPADLAQRLETFRNQQQVPAWRNKKGGLKSIDLRRDVDAVDLHSDHLRLVLTKGSPLPVVGYLLDLPPEQVRNLRVRKIDIVLD